LIRPGSARWLLAATGAAIALAAPALARAGVAPVTWCGHDEVADNRTPDLAAGPLIRFVYAIASDGADNFSARASGIATDAAWIDDWWQKQDPSRTPRFDRYPFPGCTSRFGALDLGFVRLAHTAAFYRSGDMFDLLSADLARTFPDSQKTIVYYDGPVADSRVCGISPDYQQFGGDFGIAYVFLGSSCDLSPPGSGTSAVVAAHELIHDLGGIADQAPNRCGDSAHACDSATDILYPYVGYLATLDVLTLDYNRDDYYGHAQTWWDVQDSNWLSHLPEVSLTLRTAGTGTLVVRAGSTQVSCETGCTGIAVDNGTVLTLAALPAGGWEVGSWTNACKGKTPTCVLTLAADTDATVTFIRSPLRLSVAVTGNGRVTSSPAGLACSARCARVFEPGAHVRLVAAPARGWRFAGWSGGCGGRGTCIVSNQVPTVRARFVRK
jgi:List-Bact-rpt repeat protein